jgi:hypothetical protein
MRAEIYSQLIKLGFEEEEATPMSEEFARLLGGLGTAGYKVFGRAAKAIILSVVESWAVAILF